MNQLEPLEKLHIFPTRTPSFWLMVDRIKPYLNQPTTKQDRLPQHVNTVDKAGARHLLVNFPQIGRNPVLRHHNPTPLHPVWIGLNV